MATTVQDPPDQSMVSLVGGIVNDVHDLITQQISLTRVEVKDELRKVAEVVLILIAGAGMMLVGAILSALMLVHLTHWLASPTGADSASIPLWACYGLVGVVFGVVGACFVFQGKKKAQSYGLISGTLPLGNKESIACQANKK